MYYSIYIQISANFTIFLHLLLTLLTSNVDHHLNLIQEDLFVSVRGNILGQVYYNEVSDFVLHRILADYDIGLYESNPYQN